MAAPSNTIVLGAGIIGLSTAYYLSHHQPPSTIHVVDPSPGLFASSASGLAGGFLALDWFPAAAADLGRLSFSLHARLAEEEGGRERWGYCRSLAWSYARAGMAKKGARVRGEDWLRQGASRASAAGSGGGGDDAGSTGDSVKGPRWLRCVAGDGIEAIGDASTTAQV